MTNKEILRKKIIYRSVHRGSKEMDLLLSSFVKKVLYQLDYTELEDLLNLINIEDEVLQKWYFDKNSKNLVLVNKISKMFKDFKP